MVLSFKDFKSLSRKEKGQFLLDVRLPHDFQIVSFRDGLPRAYSHRWDIPARLVFAANVNVGLTEQEHLAAQAINPDFEIFPDRLRPVRKRNVRYSLIAERPVLAPFFEKLSGETYGDALSRQRPVQLPYDGASEFCEQIGAVLPSDEEWEYCCRAGSQSLFYFGNELPDEAELSILLNDKLLTAEKLVANDFGFYGMLTGEWIMSPATESYEEDSPVREDCRVARGGGAAWWPWQLQEWTWCMSANRRLVPVVDSDPPTFPPVEISAIQAFRPVWHLDT